MLTNIVFLSMLLLWKKTPNILSSTTPTRQGRMMICWYILSHLVRLIHVLMNLLYLHMPRS
uniref:Uncharacterized protein n=1 Tax=Cannabis sativa TaxID=3483 RepID=A0A803QZS5_CANSA